MSTLGSYMIHILHILISHWFFNHSITYPSATTEFWQTPQGLCYTTILEFSIHKCVCNEHTHFLYDIYKHILQSHRFSTIPKPLLCQYTVSILCQYTVSTHTVKSILYFNLRILQPQILLHVAYSALVRSIYHNSNAPIFTHSWGYHSATTQFWHTPPILHYTTIIDFCNHKWVWA